MSNNDLTNSDVNSLRDEPRPFLVRLRVEDWERLEMICALYGLSKATVMRMSLVAMCRDLGLSKE
jgi:hypothetical protein